MVVVMIMVVMVILIAMVVVMMVAVLQFQAAEPGAESIAQRTIRHV